jgi:hypothetical protein
VTNPYFGIIPRSSSLGDPTIPVAQLLKPYPAYTTVSLYRNNVGNTRYHGLELSVRQRLARGLSYSIAYTRSKLMDDASTVFDASILTGPLVNPQIADSFDRSRERDYSTGDIPHVFVSSVVWDLPFGAGRAHHLSGVIGAIFSDWSATSLITLQSGVPIPVTQTTNFNSALRLRCAATQSGGRPDAARRSAHARSVVQHRRILHGSGVHPRIGLAQSRSRPVVSRRRSRAHAPRTRSCRPVARDSRGDFQHLEHAEPWCPQRRSGNRCVRKRSPPHSIREWVSSH